MRVLVASTSYPSHAEDPSGHFVRTEALAVARAGADVHVLAPRPMAELELEERVVPHSFGGDALFSWPGAIARAKQNPLRLATLFPVAHRLHRSLRSLGRFDRAVLHFLVPTALACASLLDGCSDVEAVAHGADVRLLVRAPALVRRWLVRGLLERCARIRFVAHHLYEELATKLDIETRARLETVAFVRPAEIDVTRAHAARTTDDARAYAVWVGRDIASKRLDTALAAAELAGVELVVVGALRRSETAREGRATFLGQLPRSEALDWIAGARVLVSTSTAEGAPTVVREARALDVPVVACAAGDLARWAASDRGISITSADPHSLARSIRDALA